MYDKRSRIVFTLPIRSRVGSVAKHGPITSCKPSMGACLPDTTVPNMTSSEPLYEDRRSAQHAWRKACRLTRRVAELVAKARGDTLSIVPVLCRDDPLR